MEGVQQKVEIMIKVKKKDGVWDACKCMGENKEKPIIKKEAISEVNPNFLIKAISLIIPSFHTEGSYLSSKP